jgi:uncharacterized protein (DUF1778 family)
MPAQKPRQQPTADRRSTRATRLNLRTTGRQNALIRDAAKALGKSVSEFVLESATLSAERVLADRRLFSLDDDAWQQFEDALARTPVAKPRLNALLRDPAPGPFAV